MSLYELKTALAAIASRETALFRIVETEHATKGSDLEVTVSAEDLLNVCELLDQVQFTLEAITGIDWPEQDRMEIVYDFTLFASGFRVIIRVFARREEAVLPSLAAIYPAANWHERETHDFFGIHFTGHPELTPLLLPEDADFHPLRKDFTG